MEKVYKSVMERHSELIVSFMYVGLGRASRDLNASKSADTIDKHDSQRIAELARSYTIHTV